MMWVYKRTLCINNAGSFKHHPQLLCCTQLVGGVYFMLQTITGGFCFFSSLISLIADGPHHFHPACGHK